MRMWNAESYCSAATSISDCVNTFAPMMWDTERAPPSRKHYVPRKPERKLIAFIEPDKSSIHLAPVPPPHPENYEEVQ